MGRQQAARTRKKKPKPSPAAPVPKQDPWGQRDGDLFGQHQPIETSRDALTISTARGRPRTGSVTITARRSCRLRLRVRGDDFAIVSPTPATGIKLEAGADYVATILYSPRTGGSVQGTLELTSTAAAGPTLTLDSRSRVALKGTVEKVVDGPQEERTPYDIKPEPRRSPKWKKVEKPIEVDLVTDREDYDASVWNVPKLVDGITDGSVVALDNLEAALDIFKVVVSHPSKEEASARGALEVGLVEIQKLMMKLIAKPVLNTVPVIGSALYETFKTALSIAEKVDKESQRSADAQQGNALKSFVVAQIESISEARSALKIDRSKLAMKAQNRYAQLSESSRADFKEKLFQTSGMIRQRVGGALSQPALFTRLVRRWTVESPQISGAGNRLVITLDSRWNLLGATLVAPYGDRLAEALLRKHGGSLNVVQLGVPLEIKWVPFSEKPGGGLATCSARLAPDGTLESIRATGPVANPEALISRMEELLVKRGVPEVTKLSGTKL